MKRVFQITLFLLSALLWACQDERVVEKLQDVESFIEGRPDSAMAVIRSIDTTSLVSREAKAKYALLHSMALYKNYIDTTDWRIIQPAVDYYGRQGTPEEKLKAYYYQGLVFLFRGEYGNALISLSEAEELVPESKDYQYTGLLYSALSDAYNIIHNFDEELRYVDLAADAFNRTNDKKYFYTTLYRKAQALSNSKKYEEAAAAYELLMEEKEEISKRNLRAMMEDYAQLLVVMPNRNPKKSLELFREVLSDGQALRSVNLWSSYAFALSECGYKQESESVFSQLYSLNNGDCSVIDIWKGAACEANGDIVQAFTLLKRSLAHQDSLLNLSLTQSAIKAQKDFYRIKSNQLEIEKQRKQLIFHSIAVILLITFLFFAILYIFYKGKAHKLEEQNDQLARIAETVNQQLTISEGNQSALQEEVSKREIAMSKLRAEFAHAYQSQFRQLGKLFETFLTSDGRKDSHKFVYDKVKDMMKDIIGDKSGQMYFEQMIDKNLDNIMFKFRQDFVQYSEEDYRFVSYIFSGFDATTLSVIFGTSSVNAVYMKKSRMRTKIRESSSPNKDYYLVFFT